MPDDKDERTFEEKQRKSLEKFVSSLDTHFPWKWLGGLVAIAAAAIGFSEWKSPNKPAESAPSSAHSPEFGISAEAKKYENPVITSIGYKKYESLTQEQKAKLLTAAQDLYETLYSANLHTLGVDNSIVGGDSKATVNRVAEIVSDIQKSTGLSEQEAHSIRDTLATLTIGEITSKYPDKIKSQPKIIGPGDHINLGR